MHAADIEFSRLVDLPADASSGSELLKNTTIVSLELKDEGASSRTLTVRETDGRPVATVPVMQPGSLWRSPHGNVYMLQGPPVLRNGEQPTFVLRPRSPAAAAAALSALHAAVQDGAAGTVAAARPAPGAAAAANTFDQKTDAASAHLYFHYYGQLMHQQNMLQDYIRTGTCYSAITENAGDFAGKAVMDVGCGSGILSLFAAQAGARVVYALQALEGWLVLVRALAAEARVQLGGVVNQVVVALMEPLQEGGPACAAAGRVVAELIAACRAAYPAKLRAMPPLPQWPPELAHVNALLAEGRGVLSAREQAELLLEGLGDESASVRSTALQELRALLAARRDWALDVQSAAPGSADGALGGRLLAALLKCCEPEAAAAASAAAQQACGECLGMLGAADPARVQIDPQPPAPMCTSDGELVVALLTKHLVRLLKTAPNLQTLDAATFAIQELLRSFAAAPGLAPAPPPPAPPGRRAASPAGNALFGALPEEVQAIVRPYLDSKYSVRSGGVRPRGVVFSPAISFRRWLALWLTQLAEHHAAGDRLPLFRAAIPVMRFDIPTAMFLAPYLVHAAAGRPGGGAAVAAEIGAVLKAPGSSREGALCLQAVFSLLDVLQRWSEEAKTGGAAAAAAAGAGSTSRSSSGGGAGAGAGLPAEWAAVGELLRAVPKEALARAAAASGAHARALLCFETHVRAVRGGGANLAAHCPTAVMSDAEVTFLQEVYGRLEEPDGLDGLVKLRRGGPRPEDQRMAAENAGCWGEALTLYERDLAHEGGGGLQAAGGGGGGLSPIQRGHLNCLLQMGHWRGLLTQVRGLGAELGGGTSGGGAGAQLAAMGTAAAWRLGQWAQLDAHLAAAEAGYASLDPDARWEVRVGRVLRSLVARDEGALRREIEAARGEVMGPFSAAAMESYTRAYPHLVRLHMLQEVADVAALLPRGDVGPRERARLLRWGERLALTQASLATQAPILALRRQLAALSGAPAEAGQCWLQHAQLCRATGQHDAAAAPVLEAAAAGVPGAALERVELLYSRGEQTRAIAELSALSEAPAPEGAPEGDAARRQRAGVLLELARWTAEAGQGARDEVTGLFQRALELQPGWESGLFRYATYLDQLMQDARTRQQAPGAGAAGAAGSRGRADDRLGGASRIKLGEDRHHLDLLPEVIGNYGRSVEAGSAHIYRALPRLLTLWFEFGATPAGDEATVPKGSPRVAAAVHERMRAFGRGLPLHAWITALPQLISRLCHPNPEVAAVTRHIIARVTEAYPQQAMWALVGVSKSAVAARRAAASAVVAAAKRAAATNDQRRAFVEVGTFTEQLVKLCNHKPAKSVVSARKEYGHLVRSMPLAVMVPCSAMTTVLLPPAGAPAPPGWRPYPEAVTVAGMDDRVQVMSSLQKPKKIALLGSDGAEYVFLAKPNDDLRKDCRMMEAAGVLNRVFAEEPASRRRTLYLRRFAVTPITEECGLVEWVPATRPMRHCIQDVNAAEGLVLDKNADNAVVRAKYVAACAGLEPEAASVPALVAWLDWTLQSHPPAFHRWFVARWPEPAAWFNARMRFTRTYAAWCMVGHVVGLGDRHGENILMDQSTGDTVHIDFACLFDKGLTLRQPEMVPFRLTQNVVDALGVAGVEGAFRRSCEVVLGVLRCHSGTILSVMDAFLHDPLVEWTQRKGKGAAGGAGPAPGAGEGGDNPAARDALATIEGRLRGTLLGVRSRPCMPLSVEGHAHRLILEAANKENLAILYLWWQAWF